MSESGKQARDMVRENISSGKVSAILVNGGTT
jgi:hypothetical protein